MAPTNILPREGSGDVIPATSGEDDGPSVSVIIGIVLAFGLIPLCFGVYLFIHSYREKSRGKGKPKGTFPSSNQRINDYSHGHDYGHRHHSRTRNGSTRQRNKDVTRVPRLDKPLPALSTNTYPMRPTPPRGKSASSQTKSRRAPRHSPYQAIGKPPALAHGYCPKALQRDSLVPQRQDTHGFSPSHMSIRHGPVVRAQIKPATGVIPQPTAASRHLQSTEKFPTNPAERTDRIQDDKTFTTPEVNEIIFTASDICDYSKLLDLETSTLGQQAKKHDSSPKLPLIDFDAFDGGLTLEFNDEKSLPGR